ncbi:MAG: hypothetical protein RLZZ234_552 [Candidatus Parcubacteria bacterium]|jgi:hypothetical protein
MLESRRYWSDKTLSELISNEMSEVLHTNIFFIITSISVVVVTCMVAVALYYLIRILRAVRDIAERVREGSEVIAEDVATVRAGIVSGRFFTDVVKRASAMTGFGARRTKRTKKTDTTNDDVPEEQEIDIE